MMKSITISKSYGVPIVEDAAEALGAIFKGSSAVALVIYLFFLLTVIK